MTAPSITADMAPGVMGTGISNRLTAEGERLDAKRIEEKHAKVKPRKTHDAPR